MMDVINLAGELYHSIETRQQIPACMALQWNETKDETALEKRFGRRHEARRQVWWLSPDDRKWLQFPDRYHIAADEAGVLRVVRGGRETNVEVYEPEQGETAMLYELGVPVVETGDRNDVNILQKVPLNVNRDNVPPAYLRTVRTLLLLTGRFKTSNLWALLKTSHDLMQLLL
jgi:hypothetical protein